MDDDKIDERLQRQTSSYLHWRETEQIETSAAQVHSRKSVVMVAKKELTIVRESL